MNNDGLKWVNEVDELFHSSVLFRCIHVSSSGLTFPHMQVKEHSLQPSASTSSRVGKTGSSGDQPIDNLLLINPSIAAIGEMVIKAGYKNNDKTDLL